MITLTAPHFVREVIAEIKDPGVQAEIPAVIMDELPIADCSSILKRFSDYVTSDVSKY